MQANLALPTPRRATSAWMRANPPLLIALGLLFPLALAVPHRPLDYLRMVDGRTLGTLTGLLILTTGLRESACFDLLARRLLRRAHSERALAVALIMTTALLSTLLTNDVALFIVVPLTLSVQQATGGDVRRLIVLEAMAANVGSALTPIGNPQNIVLWQRWGMSPLTFVVAMFPPTASALALLGGWAWLRFDSGPPTSVEVLPPPTTKRGVLLASAVALPLFLTAVEVGAVAHALLLLILLYALAFRQTLRRVDWSLLLLFALIFVDAHLLVELSPIRRLITSSLLPLYWRGILLAQVIGNVPATLLLIPFVPSWRVLAYAVNIGGNGTAVASMANLIALHLAGDRCTWGDYHRYAIPYLIVTAAVGWVWLA